MLILAKTFCFSRIAGESPQPDNYSRNTNVEQQLDDQDSSAAEDQESQEDVSKEQTGGTRPSYPPNQMNRLWIQKQQIPLYLRFV